MSDPIDLRGRVAALFATDLHLEVPGPDVDLFEEGVLDSLSFVALLSALEREFGLSVPMAALDLEHFASLDAIARFVGRRLAGTPDAESLPIRA